jgi:SAM-dependent methyltransferase
LCRGGSQKTFRTTKHHRRTLSHSPHAGTLLISNSRGVIPPAFTLREGCSDARHTPRLPPHQSRQQTAWSTGNYAVIGTTLQSVGENLCEALDIRAGSRVLDVAAGNGNASLAAARRYCEVTSTDYVPDLLETARRRALAENLTILFREADAESLPFSVGAFDVVLSTFGVMFTPDQEKAANEFALVAGSQAH